VNGFAAMDAPIALSQLLDVDQLARVLASIESLHPVSIEIRDRKGTLVSTGPEIDADQRQVREDIEYNGDIVGRIHVSAHGDGDPDLKAVAEHVAAMLSVLIHSSYARHLTTTIHEAAMTCRKRVMKLGVKTTSAKLVMKAWSPWPTSLISKP
jgi:hypothetical protein